MQSPEYGEILTSLQEMVRKAYVLGRSEALKQVIDVMQKDETTWKPLALEGPAEPAPGDARLAADPPPDDQATTHGVDSAAGSGTRQPNTDGTTPSWWARPPRSTRRANA